MNLKKAVTTVGAAVALAVAASTASAAPIFPTFQVDASVLGAGAGSINPFTANDIAGEYNETLTFTSATTFTVSIQFSAGQWVLDDTGGNTTYTAAQTGLGNTGGYGMYALFTGSGTVAGTGGAGTTFTLSPGGSLGFWLDPSNDTTFTQPATGSAPYTTSASSDDLLLASGAAINGVGGVFSGPNLFGAFGQTTSFSLTPNGSLFFISPVPFYPLSFESGQFEPFTFASGDTIRLTGTLNANFKAPEPSVIALVGIALLGLGFTLRRPKRG